MILCFYRCLTEPLGLIVLHRTLGSLRDEHKTIMRFVGCGSKAYPVPAPSVILPSVAVVQANAIESRTPQTLVNSRINSAGQTTLPGYETFLVRTLLEGCEIP